MQPKRNRPVWGKVYEVRRNKGVMFYWRIRLPEGYVGDDGKPRNEERKPIGPKWTGRGEPEPGTFNKRTANNALADRLTELRRGAGQTPRATATFRDAAETWFAQRGAERDWKPSTRRDYRSALDRHLLPAFGDLRLDAVTTEAVERWRREEMAAGRTPRRTAVKLRAMLHSIFEHARSVYGVRDNPIRDVSPLRVRYQPEDYDFYSPEQVWQLVRHAVSDQDGAIFLTAAFAGLRLGEALALRVRDVDFQASSIRVMGSVDAIEGVGTTKSGRGRTVPMVPDVAQALAKLLQRERFTGPADFAFVGDTGRYLDGSALRRRYRDAQAAAKLSKIRLHDLRHTFGSLAVRVVDRRALQAYMGHADARTTDRYTHYRQRADEAAKLAGAFKLDTPATAIPDVVADEAER